MLGLRLSAAGAVVFFIGLVATHEKRQGPALLFNISDGLLLLGLSTVIVWAVGGLFPGVDWGGNSTLLILTDGLVLLGLIDGSWVPSGPRAPAQLNRAILLTLSSWLVGALLAGVGLRAWRRSEDRSRIAGRYASNEDLGRAGAIVARRESDEGEAQYRIQVEFRLRDEEWEPSLQSHIWVTSRDVEEWASREHFIAGNCVGPHVSGGPTVLDVVVSLEDSNIHGGVMRKTLTPMIRAKRGYVGSTELPVLGETSRVSIWAECRWLDRRLEDVVRLVDDWSPEGALTGEVPAPDVLLGDRTLLDIPVPTPMEDIQRYVDQLSVSETQSGITELHAGAGLFVHLLGTGLETMVIKVAITPEGLKELSRRLEKRK